MVNLLGYEYAQNDYLPQRQQLAALPHAHVHWYGKTDHVLVESWGTSPSGWMPKTDLRQVRRANHRIHLVRRSR